MRRQKGIVLIVVLAIVLLVVLAVTYFSITGISELKMAAEQNNSTKALYLAEAGIQYGIYELKSNFSTYKSIASVITIDKTLGQGSYQLGIAPPSYDATSDLYTFLLTSTGTVRGVDRAIRQNVVIKGPNPWPGAFDYMFFGNSGKMEIKEDVIITGDVYQNGDVELKEDSTVGGTVYNTGSFEAKTGATPQTNVYPDPEVPFPALDTSFYDGELNHAGNNGDPGGSWNIMDLGGGTTYIDGDVTISSGGSIIGPGTIVVTENIELKENSSVGADVTIIVGKTIEIKENSTTGLNALLYATEKIEIKEQGVVMSHSALVTPGHIEIKESMTFEGIMYGGDVELKEESNITGSVLSAGGIEVKGDIVATYDASVFPTVTPPGLGGDSGNGDATLDSVSDWKEI